MQGIPAPIETSEAPLKHPEHEVALWRSGIVYMIGKRRFHTTNGYAAYPNRFGFLRDDSLSPSLLHSRCNVQTTPLSHRHRK